MQKNSLALVSLLFLAGAGNASSYVSFSASSEDLTANSFKFHNPDGTQFTQNSVSGSYIDMGNVRNKSDAN